MESRDELIKKRRDSWNALLCAGIVACAIVVVWPFAELAFGDDTAYSHVALVLARTGRLVYNGWEAAALITHAYWGAFFIRVFGFSFNCLRFSTFPFALGSVAFCYLVTRRMGLSQEKSLLATLIFGLSPLFLPVAVSYMTDVPGLFFMLACFYCFVRAAEASEDANGYIWLLLGLLMAVVGGTGRQSVWFVPLIVLPHLAWIRRRTWFSVVTACGWLVVLASVAASISWFNRQPDVVFQPSLVREVEKAVSAPIPTLIIAARFSLMLVLLCLPAAIPLVVKSTLDALRGSRSRQILVATLLLAVFLAILIHPSLASIPWAYSTLDWSGINGDAPLPGRPIVLTRPVRAIVAIVVYVATCLLLGEVIRTRELARRAWPIILDGEGKFFALAAMSRLCVLYFAVIVIRSTDFDVFDRYLLPIIPWITTVFLLWAGTDELSERIWRRAKPYSWAVLGILGFYAIASTQDLWALARARAAAARKLEIAGVPRTEIDAGFEYNAWTQLMAAGQMNSRWVVNPPGAYNPKQSETPVVVPKYRLEYETTRQTEASPFGSIPYWTVMPPFQKHVRIDRIIDQK